MVFGLCGVLFSVGVGVGGSVLLVVVVVVLSGKVIIIEWLVFGVIWMW